MPQPRQYPGPEEVGFPTDHRPSPFQELIVNALYENSWKIVMIAALLAINGLQGIAYLRLSGKQVTREYYTLQGAFPVVVTHDGIAIDSVEYAPGRLAALVEQFVEARYAYDWQNTSKFQAALRLMDARAVAAEEEKIRALNAGTTVVARGLKVRLLMDYDNMVVRPLGRGRFQVTVSGQAEFTEDRGVSRGGARWVQVSIPLTVQTAATTRKAPLGYVVVSTGRDLI